MRLDSAIASESKTMGNVSLLIFSQIWTTLVQLLHPKPTADERVAELCQAFDDAKASTFFVVILDFATGQGLALDINRICSCVDLGPEVEECFIPSSELPKVTLAHCR